MAGNDVDVPRELKPGDVVQVAVSAGRFSYGRVYGDGIVCFYEQDPESRREPGPPVGVREFSFCLRIDDVALPWERIGVDPFGANDEALRLPAEVIESHVPQGPPRSLESYLAESRDLAEQLVHAPEDEAAYKLGIELFQLGSRNGPEGDVAYSVTGSMHWIWGNLTDAVDAHDADPDTSRATQRMRRAAREWLTVSEDPAARARYLDHWQYVECGARRSLET